MSTSLSMAEIGKKPLLYYILYSSLHLIGKWPTSVEAMVVKNLLKCSVAFDFSKHDSFSILSPTEPGLV